MRNNGDRRRVGAPAIAIAWVVMSTLAAAVYGLFLALKWVRS